VGSAEQRVLRLLQRFRGRLLPFNTLFLWCVHPCLGAILSSQGAIQVRGQYVGTVTNVIPEVRQIFHRIPADSATTAPDARFKFFCENLLPQIANSTDRSANQNRTMIFVPSYFDYVRIRNILTDKEASYSACCEYVAFLTRTGRFGWCHSPAAVCWTDRHGLLDLLVSCCVHRYTPDANVSRARADFFHDRVDVLLYTERFHFYRRYRIRGIRHILFYAPPTTPHVYPEMLNLLQEASDRSEAVSCVVRRASACVCEDHALTTTCAVRTRACMCAQQQVLFSKYDALSLERVVGTDRAARMIRSDRSMFMLC